MNFFLDSGTIWKAKEIVRKNDVNLVESSPGLFVFQVKQASGRICTVLKKKELGRTVWYCDAVESAENYDIRLKYCRRMGRELPDRWGCVLNPKYGESEKPYCAHSKAVELWLKGYDLLKVK